MLESLSFPAAGRFIRGFGGQVAMSVAVSTAVAGVWAVPQLLFPKGGAAPVAIALADRAQVVPWVSPIAVDGKSGERHRAAIDADIEAQHRSGGLMTPAALVMPMSTGWPQPVFSEPARMVEVVVERAGRVTPVADATPVRRTALVVERARIASAAAPMATTSLASATVPARDTETAQPEPTLLGRVYEPVARAGGLVSSAAGMVGSAGSWTVAQATSLLPRW